MLLLLLDEVCDPVMGLELLLLVGSGDITDRSDLVGEPWITPGDIFAGDGELLFLSEARALFAAGLVGVDGLPTLYMIVWYILKFSCIAKTISRLL